MREDIPERELEKLIANDKAGRHHIIECMFKSDMKPTLLRAVNELAELRYRMRELEL